MTPDAAADLAARTLAAIDAADRLWPNMHSAADRERVASDLAGLRFATQEADRRGYKSGWTNWRHMQDVFEANLRRTAALYGVPEWDGTFTPAQQALHEEVEANTDDLLAALARAEYLEDEK